MIVDFKWDYVITEKDRSRLMDFAKKLASDAQEATMLHLVDPLTFGYLLENENMNVRVLFVEDPDHVGILSVVSLLDILTKSRALGPRIKEF